MSSSKYTWRIFIYRIALQTFSILTPNFAILFSLPLSVRTHFLIFSSKIVLGNFLLFIYSKDCVLCATTQEPLMSKQRKSIPSHHITKCQRLIYLFFSLTASQIRKQWRSKTLARKTKQNTEIVHLFSKRQDETRMVGCIKRTSCTISSRQDSGHLTSDIGMYEDILRSCGLFFFFPPNNSVCVTAQTSS